MDPILRNDQLSTINAAITASGKGFAPDKMDTRFGGTISPVGYNNYVYQNISLDGNIRENSFQFTTDINDPNIDLNGTASGYLFGQYCLQV